MYHSDVIKLFSDMFNDALPSNHALLGVDFLANGAGRSIIKWDNDGRMSATFFRENSLEKRDEKNQISPFFGDKYRALEN